MNRPIYFTASEETTLAGNNQGYIYSPHTLHYPGPAMELKAGETLLIVPTQPLDHGPWKIFSGTLINSEFCPELKTRLKNPKVFCVKITNKWFSKTIKIPRYTSLEALLATSGVQHIYTYLTFHDLSIMTEDEDSDNDDNNKPVASPSPPCECSCNSKT